MASGKNKSKKSVSKKSLKTSPVSEAKKKDIVKKELVKKELPSSKKATPVKVEKKAPVAKVAKNIVSPTLVKPVVKASVVSKSPKVTAVETKAESKIEIKAEIKVEVKPKPIILKEVIPQVVAAKIEVRPIRSTVLNLDKPASKPSVKPFMKSEAIFDRTGKKNPVPKAVKAAKAAEANLAKGKKEKPDAAAPVKKPMRSFFHEVSPDAERVIKRGEKTTLSTLPIDVQNRRRGASTEESPEELVERIEKELENQHIFKRNVLRPQLCTKCGLNVVSERFTIDKELGYCTDCAEILHLGETKEARKMDFLPALPKKDGAAAGEDDIDKDIEDEADE